MYVAETTRKRVGNRSLALRPATRCVGRVRVSSPRCEGRGYGPLVPAWTTTRACAAVALVASGSGCTSIDPGADFVIPEETFDPDYFYCQVEPQLLVAYKCGPGDPSKGDPPNAGGWPFSSAGSRVAPRVPAPLPCSPTPPPPAPAPGAHRAPAQHTLAACSFFVVRGH